MRRHSRAGSAKSRRRKPAALKRASGMAQPRSSSAAVEETEITRLTSELAEARQEQVATTDILRIISSSFASLEHVFKTILEHATRICEAKFGIIFQFD